MRGYLKKQKTAFGNIAGSGLEVAYEQTDTSDLRPHSKQSAELQKEIRRLEKEKAAMQKRKAELDAIFKKLYEDSVLGRITAEQF